MTGLNKINNKCWKALVSICVFFITYFLLPYYVNGDQIVYKDVYSELAKYEIVDSYYYYLSKTSGAEVIHFILAHSVSKYMEHHVFNAILSGLLGYGVLILLMSWGCAAGLAGTIVLSNFYLYVLYLPAERLKIGFLFSVFAFIYFKRIKYSLLLFILSVAAHMQMMILCISIFWFNIFGKIKKISGIIALGTVSVCLLWLFILYEKILFAKLDYYAQFGGLDSVLKLIVFLLMSCYYAKNKFEPILVFAPLICIAYIIGGDRINMFGFFVFLYYGVKIKKGYNIAVIVSTVYFAIKTVFFVNGVIVHGDGFYLN